MSASAAPLRELVLDGSSLTLDELVAAARDPRVRIRCRDEAIARVEHGWRQIERIAGDYRDAYQAFGRGGSSAPPIQDYGVTTGFGEFKNVPIHPDELEALQRNILLGHAVGLGVSREAYDPRDVLEPDVVRATLLIRLNAMLRGHSGVRPAMARQIQRMLERGIVPLVPALGSVGSSGDLAPLAHMFAVLLGVGRFAVVTSPDDTQRPPANARDASELGDALGSEPLAPSYKEGLALVNGATVSTALLALALADAEECAGAADIGAALTLEAICGCARAFDPKIHAARGQRGQADSAAAVRQLVTGSSLVDAAGAVQDAYSVRCAPAVHGATRDALGWIRAIVEREINAATDNPLFFPGDGDDMHDGEPWDAAFEANWPAGYRGRQRASYSAGNFHGQPVALAADLLAIAASELANVSERRIQLLLDRHHNRNLPANLIPHRGVHSGFMLAQYSAAAVVSENKILSHPAVVDSIPTSANTEDHVAMATAAARKARRVVAHVESVLAIEILVACQAIDWRAGVGRTPLAVVEGEAPDSEEVTAPEAVDAWSEAEHEARAFRAAAAPEARAATAARLGVGTAAVYRAVRGVVEPLVADRPLDGDVRAVRRLIAGGRLRRELEEAIGERLAPIARWSERSGG